MDIDNQEDLFLAFIDHARSVLSSVEDEEIYDPNGNGSERGSEQRRSGLSKNRQEIMNRLKRKHRRRKLAKTAIVDSVYEKNFLSLNSVLEAVIVNAFLICMLALGDFWSSNTIDLYLHRSLEATWNENAARAFFINLSFLPALLTSSCLHKYDRIVLEVACSNVEGVQEAKCHGGKMDEQFMYPSSPENESFIVALVNCQRQGYGICRQGITQDQEADAIRWEITRALRCE
uniref:Uncharacterized protein n=1 Tax=Populus alba TaxID=43335 RepID=A0A4V6A8I1_POPAL|nr:hypothetical protein D5086_0000158370 [Populus alba]